MNKYESTPDHAACVLSVNRFKANMQIAASLQLQTGNYKPATAIIPKAIKRVHEDEDDLIQFILKLFNQSRIKILNLNYRYCLNF